MSTTTHTYTIKPGDPPIALRPLFYRGDKASITFIAVENDGVTPFNLGVFNSFMCQMRVGSALNSKVAAELDPLDFILGRSIEAINYEIAQNLPTGSIYDELHCLYQSALLAQQVVKKLFFDVRAVDGLDITTFGSGSISLTHEVSRV